MALDKDLIQSLDNLFGVHAGFRPVHAKGVLLSGTFTPSPSAASLTRAPHAVRASTPVTARFSDFTGIPDIPDTDPNAGPRGFAVRFHLAEHVHTDIIGHSTDGFPTRTGEEFLGAHPKALAFVMTPKPIPVSFARESFFGVSAFKFTNEAGASQFGRFRIRPDGGGEYLEAAAAATKTPNFLFDELPARVAKGPIKLHVVVQLAATGDVVDDATIHWPEERVQLEFGTIVLTQIVSDSASQERRIIFDPIPRVDGIDPSADPLLNVRADLYLATGRRRRAAAQTTAASD